MEDIKFTSLEELYKRLKNELKTKKDEMNQLGYMYIKEIDIWNYLKEVKWIQSRNLSLYQMVSDVLNADNILIDKYLKEKLSLRN